MSNIVFDRYYKVTFKSLRNALGVGSSAGGGGEQVTFQDTFTISSNDVGEGQTALQIYGNIKKSLKASGDSPDNTLTLNIVNLPNSVVAQLNDASVLQVVLELGYNNSDFKGGGISNDPLIAEVFEGDVQNLVTNQDGLKYVTSLAALTSATDKKGADCTLTFREGALVKDCIKKIVNTFSDIYLNREDSVKKRFSGGVSTVYEGSLLENVRLENDRSFEGMTTKVLDEFLTELGVSWSYVSKRVHIYKLTERSGTDTYTVLDIEPQNVLGGLGTKFETVGKNEKSTTTPSQLTMTTFLDPRVTLETVVNIPKVMDKNGITSSGEYLPIAWAHNFKFRGGQYETSFILNRKTNVTEVNNG